MGDSGSVASEDEAEKLIKDWGLGSERDAEAVRELRVKQHELQMAQELEWLRKRNPSEYARRVDINAKRKELRQWFNTMDVDGSGDITADELEEPLVSMGFASSAREVRRMVSEVDEDGSGEIDFDEFFKMMTRGDGGSNPVVQLYDALMSGQLGDRSMNLQSLISTYRRRVLLNAMMGDPKAREKYHKAVSTLKRDSNEGKEQESGAAAVGPSKAGASLPLDTAAAPLGAAARRRGRGGVRVTADDGQADTVSGTDDAAARAATRDEVKRRIQSRLADAQVGGTGTGAGQERAHHPEEDGGDGGGAGHAGGDVQARRLLALPARPPLPRASDAREGATTAARPPLAPSLTDKAALGLVAALPRSLSGVRGASQLRALRSPGGSGAAARSGAVGAAATADPEGASGAPADEDARERARRQHEQHQAEQARLAVARLSLRSRDGRGRRGGQGPLADGGGDDREPGTPAPRVRVPISPVGATPTALPAGVGALRGGAGGRRLAPPADAPVRLGGDSRLAVGRGGSARRSEGDGGAAAGDRSRSRSPPRPAADSADRRHDEPAPRAPPAVALPLRSDRIAVRGGGGTWGYALAAGATSDHAGATAGSAARPPGTAATTSQRPGAASGDAAAAPAPARHAIPQPLATKYNLGATQPDGVVRVARVPRKPPAWMRKLAEERDDYFEA